MKITEQNIITIRFQDGITNVIAMNAASRETVEERKTDIFETITEAVEFCKKHYSQGHEVSGFGIYHFDGGFISTGLVNIVAE